MIVFLASGEFSNLNVGTIIEHAYYQSVFKGIILGVHTHRCIPPADARSAAKARHCGKLSFLVSFLTALTGFFKFREKGFNLQQTADAIELEFNSAELGILHYRKIKDSQEVLAELAEKVERLKDEQRKRQQQLEQPSANTASEQ